jgi:hypothetical protein
MVNEKYFLFDQKFFFNFRKIENGKPFFDFEYLILKSTNLVKTHPGPHQDLTGTRLELTWDPARTYLRPP